MKLSIFFVADSDNIFPAAAADLGSDFEVHCLRGISSLAAHALSSAALLCVIAGQHKAGGDSLLQSVLSQCAAQSVPVVLLAQKLAPAQRISLLQNGVADIIDAQVPQAELSLRLRRCVVAGGQAGRIAELQVQLLRLSQYFSEDVVKMILSQKSVNHDYGENLEATIFFLDIRNFTSISENVEPNLVAALLNRLYTDIMDLILTYKGSVNKIIGDALLATFGCPVRGEHDAKNAVECALAIRDTMQLFNSTRPPYIQADISIGMGIATGPVFAGTIGSYRKRDYTVIGDTVNIAARLEGLTKQTRFDLIIDRKTRELVGADLRVRKLQVNRVRGRTQPMEIFLVDSLLRSNADSGSEAVFFSR